MAWCLMHQAIFWTNVNLSWVGISGIHTYNFRSGLIIILDNGFENYIFETTTTSPRGHTKKAVIMQGVKYQ